MADKFYCLYKLNIQISENIKSQFYIKYFSPFIKIILDEYFDDATRKKKSECEEYFHLYLIERTKKNFFISQKF